MSYVAGIGKLNAMVPSPCACDSDEGDYEYVPKRSGPAQASSMDDVGHRYFRLNIVLYRFEAGRGSMVVEPIPRDAKVLYLERTTSAYDTTQRTNVPH